jgi:hypothetical protein
MPLNFGIIFKLIFKTLLEIENMKLESYLRSWSKGAALDMYIG